MEDFLVLEYMDLFFKKRRFSMSINYTMVAVIMLFVILISIQFTLNKIFMILKGSSLNYSINNPGIAWCYKPPNGNETFNIILKK